MLGFMGHTSFSQLLTSAFAYGKQLQTIGKQEQKVPIIVYFKEQAAGQM